LRRINGNHKCGPVTRQYMVLQVWSCARSNRCLIVPCYHHRIRFHCANLVILTSNHRPICPQYEPKVCPELAVLSSMLGKRALESYGRVGNMWSCNSLNVAPIIPMNTSRSSGSDTDVRCYGAIITLLRVVPPFSHSTAPPPASCGAGAGGYWHSGYWRDG